jgi:HK97 family phage portal protein
VGVFGRLTDRLFEKFIAKMAKVGGWNITQWQANKPYYPDVSYRELVKRYSSWVYVCASKNAENCAQIPLRLYAAKPMRKTKALFPTRKVEAKQLSYLAKSPSTFNYVRKAGEVDEVVEHPFLDLLKSVNDFTNQFDLLELAFLFQELCGNAYWYIGKDSALGVPTEIWPLYSQYVRIIPDKQRFIAKYEFVVTEAEKHVVDPADIVHFKYINPQDAYYGIGPLQAAVVAADLSNNMNLFEAGLFKNHARPDMALILPVEAGAPDPDEVKRIEGKWYQKFGGVKKAGKLAVLSGGAELKPISLSPKEMSFLQGRKATREEVAAIFGVPLSLITTESVNRANAETGEYSYMKNTVLPRTRRFEQKINEKLLPMYDERLFCAFDNPVPEDKGHRLKEVEMHLKTGYSSPNEERQEDGRDEVEWGHEPLLPMNIRPLSTELPSSQPMIPPKPEKGTKATLPPLNHPTDFVNEHFVKAMQAYYGLVAVEILEGFDRDMGVKSPADDYMSAWFDMQKWNGALWTTCEPFVRYTMMSGGERALRQMTVERLFDPMNPAVVHALEQHRHGSVNSVNSTIVKNLREKLAAGMSEGESVTALRDRVSGIFEDLSAYGAERVARTETIWAWNEGARQGYKQSGIVEKLQWVSSGDQRSCDWCLDMDGRIIGIDSSFFDKGDSYEVNGRELDFTYEKIDHPPIHPQCRCTIVPVLEGV